MICVIVYCDVVNVQPHFNFSDEIIILNLEMSLHCMGKYMHTPRRQGRIYVVWVVGEEGLDNFGFLLEKRKHTHAHT